MGSKVTVPPPSAEERALQAAQKESLDLQRQILEEQRAQNKILLPFLADQEGYDVETDDNGNIKKISKRADELQDMKKNLERAYTERALKAVKGELPVSPALEEEYRIGERDLRSKLSQQLGPGYETSSPGIETLGNFFRGKEIVYEGARKDEMSLAEQLSLTREQQNIYSKNTSLDNILQGAQEAPSRWAVGFGQSAQGYGQAQQPYIQHRQMQLQASIANAQSKASMFGAGLGLVGALFSDARLKHNIERIGQDERTGFPIYRFTYTHTGQEHIGYMAQDVIQTRPDAILYDDETGYLLIDYEAL